MGRPGAGFGVTSTAASILLREIGDWTAATGRTPAELGSVVLNHGGFVPLLRKRGTLKPETAAKVRDFMRTFGTAERLSGEVFARMLTDARAGAPWTLERHRSLMIRYGFMELVDTPPASVPTSATGGGQTARIGCGDPGGQARRPRSSHLHHRPDRHGAGVLAR